MRRKLKTWITFILVFAMVFTSSGVTSFTSVTASAAEQETSEVQSEEVQEEETEAEPEPEEVTEAEPEEVTEEEIEDVTDDSSSEGTSEVEEENDDSADIDDISDNNDNDKSDQNKDESSEEESSEASTEEEESTEEKVAEITLTAEAIYTDAFDEQEYVIKGHENDPINLSDDEDISSYAAEIEGYEFSGEAKIGDNTVKKIKVDETGQVSYSDGGDDFTDLTEDTKITFIYKQTFEKTEYEFENDSVKVTAILSDADAIPDDAELKVTYVAKDSEDYNYDAYMGALNDEDAKKKYTDKNTLLYDISFIRDGKEIEPAKGTVSIKMEFKDKQLTDDLGVKSENDLTVKHLPVKEDAGKESDDNSLSKDEIKVENVEETKVNPGEETAAFKTEGFSLYAFTVDFTYDGYTFSMAGKSEILLSELFTQLKIAEKVADVETAEFTNPELLTVTKKEDGDWLLKSLKAFKTEEKLTVTMNSGTKYIITVTDAQDGVYEYNINEADGNAISLGSDSDYADNWYLLSTLTKENGGTYYYVTSVALNGSSSINGSINTYYNANLQGLKIGDETSYSWGTLETASYESGDKVTNELVHVSNSADTYNKIVSGDNNNREGFGNGSVIGKYGVTTDDETGNITLKTVSDLKLKTVFKDSNGNEIPAGTLPNDYKLLIKMVRDGNTYYALQPVDSSSNPSAESEPLKFYKYTEQWGNGSLGTEPNYYSGNGSETISTQVVTGADSLTADLIQHRVPGAVFYNENTIGGTQSSDLTKDLYSTSSEIKEVGGANIMTTTFEKQKDDGKDHDMKVSFYQEHKPNISDAVLKTDNNMDTAENAYFFRVRLFNDGKLVAYKLVPVTAEDVASANSTGTFTHTIAADEEFQLVDDKGVDIAGGKLHYDPTVYTSDVRLYKANNAGQLPANLSEVSSKGTDTLNGFDFWYNNFKEIKDGDTITKTETDIGLYGAYKKKYQVQIVIDPSAAPSNADGIKMFVEAAHQTSNVDKLENINIGDGDDVIGYRTETTADGKKVITYLIEDQTTDPNTFNWTTHPNANTITGNETFTLLLKQNNKDIKGGVPVKIGNEYYSVTYDTGIVEGKNRVIDDTNDVTTITHFITLTKADYDSAIDPYDVLGEGAEYGVIADEYERKDHTETNFAVNKYIESTGAGIDLAANGGESEAMPYYIGEYNHIKFTGNTTVNPDIYTPSSSTDPYVHKKDNSEEGTDHIHQDGNGYDVTVYPTSKENVKSYVDGLIGKLTESSRTYAGKTTFKAEPGKVLDTTAFPDNITIYVDATDLDIGQTGWEIKKLEGQSIVLNIPGDNVHISKEYVYVYKKNEDGSLETVVDKLDSNTGGNGGNKDHNNAVENHILNHIVFNAYEAENVTFTDGPAGLFLAPNANFEEVNGSGTGWVATGKKFTQTGAEWHFFRTQRKYKADGDFSLSGNKQIMEGNEQKSYSEFSSMTFTFELYRCDEHGNLCNEDGTPNPTAKALDTVTADKDGKFEFKKLKYNQTDVPEGETKTFYYVIKEVVPEGGKIDGVNYDAPPVYIKVVAEDETGSEKITFEISKGNDPETWEAIVPSDNVYNIGGFPNTYEEEKGSLKVKKIVNGDDAEGTYKIAVKNSEGHYFDTDGTDKGTTAFYVEFSKDSEKTWTNLPVGTYTVEEDDASAAGYSWTVTGTGDVAVAAGQEATADVTNTYVKHTNAEIKAKKNFTGRNWKTGDSFEFTLKPVDGAPMPEGAEAEKKITVTNADAATFGNITYTEEGIYKYTVTETKGNLPGVTYDTNPHEVTVTVTKDEDTNNLVAEVTYTKGTEAEEITNTFTSVKAQPEVTKSINNWGTAESFTFTLTAKSPANAPMPAESGNVATATKTNTLAKFGEIEYTEPGTYTYTIKETDDHVPGITYDTDEHTVTVVVSQNAETNALTAEVTYDTGAKELEITNTFTKTNAELKATKAINDWGSATSFTFNLEAVDGAPMPEGSADGKKSVTVTKGGNMTAVFGTVEYDTVGEYRYTITEKDGGVPGVTYDTAEHIVVVNVHKAADSNDLVADVTYDDANSLTITNKYASANLALQATKEINEWGDAESFTFTLAAKTEGAPMPAGGGNVAVATKGSPTAVFGSIKYETAGTYTYTITEKDDHVAGITYDTTPHEVVVTVEKNNDGNLDVSAKYDNNDSLTITNEFTSLKKQLEATKKINDWGKAESFTFKLAAVTEGAPMPASDTATVTKGGSLEAVFGEIEYKTVGEYDYTITEQDDGVDGITYDTTPYPVHVSVTENAETNALEATITYGEKKESSLTITNTFTAAKATIEATKDFNDWGKAESFTFNLEAGSAVDADGNVIDSIPVPTSMTATATKSEPTASFGEIKYDQAGTYTYTITEENGGVPGVSYDTSAHTVVVTVTKGDNNKLTASVKYDDKDSLTIKNKFTAAKAKFKATKEFNDWGKAESFTFDLEAVTEGAPMPKKTDAVAKENSPAQWDELSFDKEGTYTYTITERNDGVDGVTYDTTTHIVVVTVTKADDATNKLTAEVKYDGAESLTITNTYTSTKAELQATKDFNDWGKAESFTFKLAAVTKDAPMPASDTATATKDAVDAQFGEITFEKAGTYKYTITEIDDGVDGVTYDTNPHEVVVNVTKEEGTNRLVPEIKYDNKDKLIITNTFASASVTLQATKDFNDWGKAKEFTFTLKASNPENAPMPENTEVKATKEAPTAVFGSITYDKAGTYEYTITEKDDGVDGVTYDTKAHKAVVTVTKGNGNKLTASVKYDDKDNLIITNTYEAAKATLEAEKSFEHWGKADSFTFDLEAIENAPMPEGSTDGKMSATATKDSPEAIFGEIEYDKAGTYGYTITEQNGGADGVSYDTKPHKVIVTVTKGDDNKLTASVKYDDKESLTITNEYSSTNAPISATKEFSDWGKAESFTFNLAAVTEGAPMPASSTATATKNKPVASFGRITYEKAGIYEYTITEQNGGADGVTYDTVAHKVVVTVTKANDATNKLTASVKYDDKNSLVIKNTYKSTKATLEATKSFDNWGKAESFTFNLAAVTEGAPMPANKSATATKDEPLASFGEIEYEKAGTYEYTITEVNDGEDGVSYDTTPHKVVVTVTKADDATNKLTAEVKYDGAETLTITNTYTSTKAELKATKQFNDWGKAESFTFKLAAVTEDAPMPASDTATATKDSLLASFGEVEYEKAGTYEYTITEQNDGVDGVTYDTTPHNVVVTVTKADDASNKLTAEVKYDGADSLTITNTYAGAKATLQATKSFNDWGKADSFTFKLAAKTENAPMPASDTAVATKDAPQAVFGEVEYDKAGEYKYTITEVNDGKDGVTYDTTPHEVIVTVSKNDNNKLTAVAKYDDEESLTITNTYESTKATLEATKSFEDWGKADSFTFNLAAVTEGAPMPASDTATATKDKPLASFGEIEYEKAGTYEYTITEVNGGADGVTYDITPHPVTVTVSKADDATNKLNATVKYGDADGLTITNTYTCTEATIKANKDFNDWGKADSFTFDLRAVTEGAPMPSDTTATATKDNPTASWGSIKYEKAGVYKYTIKERNSGVDGVSYDVSEHNVTVTVTKANDATNALSAKVTYDVGADQLIITNTFTAVKAKFEATKKFNDWGKAEDFTFKLAAVTKDAPMPKEDSVKATKKTPKAVWEEIEFDKTGTYEYTITEQNDGVDGVSYDVTPHKVTVKVTKANDATNALKAEVTYDGAESLTITNTFTAVKVPIQATKSFNDWGKAKDFTFTLEAVTKDAPMPEKTVAVATADVVDASFGEIEFDKAGKYEYTITETDDGIDGVTYDTTAHKVVVTVTKAEDATNALSAVVKYDGEDALIVTNTFESGKATLQATKSFNDWGKADSFTFNLEAADKKSPLPAKTTAIATKAAPTAVFGEIEYDKAGIYNYTITEVNDGVDGVSYDTTVHNVVVTVTKGERNKLSTSVKYDEKDSLIITNTFTAAKATLETTKDFKSWGAADSFTFDLAAVTKDAPMPAITTAMATEAAPTASFGEIVYDKAGTYEYTITEKNDGIGGVTYDTTPHKVIVTVTKAKDATNKLTAKVTYDGKDSLTITNTYTMAKANIKVNKAINEWGKAEYFAFDLAAVTSGAPMPEETKARATKDNTTADFGEIMYGKEGTYEYTITEENGGVEGITYDTSAHKVTVTVTKATDGSNKLTAKVTYGGADSLTITNTYGAKGSITFVGTKTLNNKELQGNDFNFEVVDNDTDEVIQTVSNDSDGNIQFEKIHYTLDDVGTHTYTVREVDPADENITVDTDSYTVTVKVEDQGNGVLKVTASSNHTELNFVNTYHENNEENDDTGDVDDTDDSDSYRSSSSKTGDNNPVALYSGIALLALLAAVFEILRRRRNNDKTE